VNAVPRATLRIGITGPIGCGKSAVAAALARRGGVVVDADTLARQATPPESSALRAIGRRFGAGVISPDGTLDRAALARIVFADPGALRDLEGIIHPAVRPLIDRAAAAAAAAGAPFVIIEAIKLVESGYSAHCDEVWLVTCAPEDQRRRLAGRGMPADDVERRMASQGADLVERLRPRATRVIDSRGTEEATVARALEALDDAIATRARNEGPARPVP
jgi:dephospho-CoA kinase